MSKFSDQERADILAEAHRSLANKDEIKRDLARRLMAMPPTDPLVRYRAEAEERAAAVEDETRRRLAESKRDQRERERIKAVVEAEIDAKIERAVVEVYTNVTTAFEQLSAIFDKCVSKTELAALRSQLDKIEKLLRSTPDERAWRN
jgi:predicted Zn-dependent protease